MNYDEIIEAIENNTTGGYETAILGNNGKAVKYGSLVSDICELPDKPENCNLVIWNNENIELVLCDYTLT
jgi:hypothetical protein